MVDVSKHLERAEKEVQKKNFDAAILIYDQIIALEPDCGDARAGKRRAGLKKFQKAYPSGAMVGLRNLGSTLMIAIGKPFRLHRLVAGAAERALTNDPRNVRLNITLGQALLALGLKGSAEAAFAVVKEFDDKDVESLKILGQLYYDTKKYDKALECYERVLELVPRDQVAVKMRKNLAAEGAIKTGGFESAATARDLAKSKGQMEELEKRQKLVTSADELGAAIAEIESKVKAEPNDTELLIRLGTLCLQNRDVGGAVKAFERALAARPGDGDIASRLGDAKLAEFDLKIREAKEMADDGDEAADELCRRLAKERRSYRVVEYKRRVHALPTDLSLRFQLGQYLLDDNQIDESIGEFQLAVKDPKKKIAAMTALGQAFMKKGLGDLAIKQLQGALEGSGGVTDRSKDVAYSLAAALEQTGNHKDALATYAKIYEIDIAFRDVARKIESLRAD